MSNLQQGINDLATWCKNNEFGNQLIQEWTGIEQQSSSTQSQSQSQSSQSSNTTNTGDVNPPLTPELEAILNQYGGTGHLDNATVGTIDPNAPIDSSGLEHITAE